MDIKKMILTILMLFLLNFSVPLGGQMLIIRQKNIIAYVITSDENDNVSNLIKENNKYLLSKIISLYIQISLINIYNDFYNTS